MNIEHLRALREQRMDIVASIEERKAILQQIDDKISDVLSDIAYKAMEAAGKNSGDVTITPFDGLRFKASVSKTVKYDTEKLMRLASTMPGQKVTQLFKIDFSVSEESYKALQKFEPELAAKIEEARTVKYGAMKIIPIE